MSGYLQRIVQGARSSGPIRPMAGSIFAGPRGQWTGDPFERVEETVAEGRAEPLLAPPSESPRRSGETKETKRSDFTATPVPPRMSAGERMFESRGREAPAAERTAFDRAAAEPSRERVEAPVRAAAMTARPAQTSETAHSAKPPALEVAIGRLLRPTAAEQPGSAVPPLPTPASPIPWLPNLARPAAAAASRRQGGNVSAGRNLPAREPDEIQIHIGRIEVTAAPPAVVRPAPAKSAHKSPDLGAYLNRRGGSGR